jgi:hypothetical protein
LAEQRFRKARVVGSNPIAGLRRGEMSRFIEKLNRIHQKEPQAMGFMISKPSQVKPRMQIAVSLTADNPDKDSANLASADAVIVQVAKSSEFKSLEKICQAKDGLPAGGWVKAAESDTLKKLMDTACDFVIFSANAPLTIIPKEKVGRILQLDASLSEGLLRTANDLPVDAVLIADETAESPLTLDRLMFIQRLAYLISKPIMVKIPMNLSEDELQAIWNTGVSGIVVELNEKQPGEKIAELRGIIEKLQPPAANKKSKMSPILPRMQPESPTAKDDEDGEEEEGE